MRLVKDSISVLLVRLAGLLGQLAVFALIARTHSLSGVGIYAFVTAFWLIIRVIGPLGYDQAAMRFVPGYLVQKRYDWVLEFINSSNKKIKHYMYFLSAILCVVGIFFLVFGGEYSLYGIPILVMAAGVPAYALIGLDVCMLRAHGKVTLAQIPESLYLPVILAIGISVTTLADVTTAEYTLVIQSAAAWIVVLKYRLMLFRLEKDHFVHKGAKLNFEAVQRMASTTLKGMIATALSGKIPVILLSLVGTAATVGLFEGALRLGLLGTIFTWVVGIVVSPMMAKAVAESDFHSVQKMYAVAGVMQAIPAFGVLVILAVFGDSILTILFGDTFHSAYTAAVVLALASTVNAVGAAASSYLLMTGGEKIVQSYSIWALVIVVFGVPIGALLGGLVGAAWALVLRSLVRDIGLTIMVAKTRKLIPGLLSVTQMKWMIINIISHLRVDANKRM